jgi:hypothetical protein
MSNWKLKPGDTVKTTDYGIATVKKQLGCGGQGDVYLVDYEGKDMALKWYKPQILAKNKEKFRENVKHKIDTKAPSPAFLWPEHLTEIYDTLGLFCQGLFYRRGNIVK